MINLSLILEKANAISVWSLISARREEKPSHLSPSYDMTNVLFSVSYAILVLYSAEIDLSGMQLKTLITLAVCCCLQRFFLYNLVFAWVTSLMFSYVDGKREERILIFYNYISIFSAQTWGDFFFQMTL